LAALQRLKNKQPLMHQPVMRSINIHGPSCKDGGKWQPFWWGWPHTLICCRTLD
jgi:hypothetical protein